jgi:DNA invertase Pin-like site-specific DNA recombinase
VSSRKAAEAITTAEERAKATATSERPLAYSYVRFSTPEQAKGASYDRQIEAARAYAHQKGWQLAEATYTDLGVSAFRHKNAQTGALRAFLKHVEDGDIPRGSYLLIEALDRLTREAILEASSLFGLIISAGITIVTLLDRKEYSHAGINSTPTDLVLAIVLMMRGHEESLTKSRRLADVYERKRATAEADAAAGKISKVFTKMLPAWLEWREQSQAFSVIHDRAKVVRRIFAMADAGMGQHAISQRLDAEGVPTFPEKGRRRRSVHWQRTYIKHLLTNSAVIGSFTPHQRRTDAQGKRRRVPVGTVENYYPAIIERELFDSVAARARATAARGRNAGGEIKSLFAGLLKCSRCGGTVTRVAKANHVYLVCSLANRKAGCLHQAVRYEHVEGALRQNARAVIEDAPRGLETAEADHKIANLDTVVGVLADEARSLADALIVEKSNVVRQRLREREQELEAAREQLRQLQAHRDTLARPQVQRRLYALRTALTAKPFNVVPANSALKEAASRVVLNPESGELTIYWHHAPEQPSEAGPFYSRHNTTFTETDGYVHRPKRRGGS